MSPPPTIYTPPSELDGTIAGIVVTAVVATLALVLLIGMVYWAASHPDARTPMAQRPEEHRPGQATPPRNVSPGRGRLDTTSSQPRARADTYHVTLARAEPDAPPAGSKSPEEQA